MFFGRCSEPNGPLSCAERAAFCFAQRRKRDTRCSRPLDPDERQPRASLARALALKNFDEHEIDWQIEVIRENTKSLSKPADPTTAGPAQAQQSFWTSRRLPTKKTFIAEADKIADELSRHAIRRGPGAAWIGLDWLGDAEVFQLVCLGPDLYNGASGIALFLAAHAAATGRQSSAELARAAVAHLRKNLKSRNAARMARSLGVGGATGLGSIVYALAVMSKCLRDDELACGRTCGGGTIHR